MATIDTLAYFEELRKAGNTELEAKAHVYALNNNVTDMVNSSDIVHLEDRMKGEFAVIKTSLDITQRIGGGLLIACFALLLKIAIWP